mmetsp:Transcript_25697/g.57755  ORF Transcript_25697/g.57755 Transcript_25697/m.57755 type:complete len:195 (+) Transcript_25697:400-984(+)
MGERAWTPPTALALSSPGGNCWWAMQDEDIEFFISCGADAVFAKPLNKESVDKLLVRISVPRAEGNSDSCLAAHSHVSLQMGPLSQPALDAMLASLVPTAGVAVSEPAKKTPAPKTLTPTKLPKPTRRVEKTNLRPIQEDAEEPDHDLDQAVLAGQPEVGRLTRSRAGSNISVDSDDSATSSVQARRSTRAPSQ